jgi:hypothetical protein
MAQFWENAMALTDADRFNVTKAFDYFDNRHFEEHVACVKRGIRYHWLLYESSTAVRDWERYTRKLRRRANLSEPVLRDKVECRILPVDTRKKPWIPFRITMFGNDICLCGAERRPNTYRLGKDTIALGCADGFMDLKLAFDRLFEKCPNIEAWQHWQPSPEVEAAHDTLRREFLGLLKESYSQDLPIAYSEANLAIALVGALSALAGAAIAVALHLLSVHYR